MRWVDVHGGGLMYIVYLISEARANEHVGHDFGSPL